MCNRFCFASIYLGNLSCFGSSLFLVFAVAFSFNVAIANDSSPNRPPNFVVILTDDLGYGDIACFGAQDIATPNIDAMAEEGVKLTSFYVSPVCSPTRASLMTGCYSQRVGIGGVLFERNSTGLSHDEITLPECLKGQGYTTAIVGKWHLGYRKDQYPIHHGFDSWYGTIASNNTAFTLEGKDFAEKCLFGGGLSRESIETLQTTRCSLMRNNEVVEVSTDQTQLTRKYTEESIRFIADNKDAPFFLYLAHNMPHIPLHASDAFRGKSDRGLYGDVIEELDWSVGEVLKAIKQHGVDENTLVIFTSDNGPKLTAGGSAGTLRGGKGSSFEGGVRVPCIMRWPGRIDGGRVVNEPSSIIDVLPTLVNWAGGRPPEDRTIDGRDLGPLVCGSDAQSPHQAFFYLRGAGTRGIRVGDWKYILEESTSSANDSTKVELTKEERNLPRAERKALIKQRRSRSSKRSTPALYILRDDLGEQRNLVEDYPRKAKQLADQMQAFQKELRNNQRSAGSKSNVTTKH
ncbi:MAG: sulfatase [Planctomycetota bacterium]